MSRWPTWSLRTLLVILTLCGVILGCWAGVRAERRRQARLLEKALQMAEADGAKVSTYEMEDPPFGVHLSVSLEGGALAEETAHALVEARRIDVLGTRPPPSEAAQQILSEGYERLLPVYGIGINWERE